jgi:distribution and morphology protein 34
MAFNFNWSPLTADADFYERAQEMLTTALNKSPKPPIIVDDILVNELNLGSVPPELEILEIGDLAEDRFRGIFKMCYSGDAFLTLKTRVQVCRTASQTPHIPFCKVFTPGVESAGSCKLCRARMRVQRLLHSL